MSRKQKKDTSDTNLSYKFLILGDKMVGKTSVLERYVNNTFKTNYLTTIGMDKRFKRLEINNKDVDVFFTDTAGEERFRSLTKMFYKDADGIFIGFSLTEKNTLESINYWVEQIDQNCNNKGKDLSLVLFGNKCDDKENIQVKQEDIDVIKSKHNLTYFETSAKDNINIQNLFEFLIKSTIINKGDLKSIGLPENASIDDIKINIKENQKLEIVKSKPKKKRFC